MPVPTPGEARCLRGRRAYAAARWQRQFKARKGMQRSDSTSSDAILSARQSMDASAPPLQRIQDG